MPLQKDSKEKQVLYFWPIIIILILQLIIFWAFIFNLLFYYFPFPQVIFQNGALTYSTSMKTKNQEKRKEGQVRWILVFLFLTAFLSHGRYRKTFPLHYATNNQGLHLSVLFFIFMVRAIICFSISILWTCVWGIPLFSLEFWDWYCL